VALITKWIAVWRRQRKEERRATWNKLDHVQREQTARLDASVKASAW
jgi:hypothetical protein